MFFVFRIPIMFLLHKYICYIIFTSCSKAALHQKTPPTTVLLESCSLEWPPVPFQPWAFALFLIMRYVHESALERKAALRQKHRLQPSCQWGKRWYDTTVILKCCSIGMYRSNMCLARAPRPVQQHRHSHLSNDERLIPPPRQAEAGAPFGSGEIWRHVQESKFRVPGRESARRVGGGGGVFFVGAGVLICCVPQSFGHWPRIAFETEYCFYF